MDMKRWMKFAIIIALSGIVLLFSNPSKNQFRAWYVEHDPNKLGTNAGDYSDVVFTAHNYAFVSFFDAQFNDGPTVYLDIGGRILKLPSFIARSTTFAEHR